MIEAIQKKIIDSEPFRALARGVTGLKPGEPLQLQGISGSLMAFVAAFAQEQRNGQVLLVVSDNDRGEQLRDDCAALVGDNRVRFFGEGSSHQAALLDMTAPISQIETLQALSVSEQVIVVTSVAALMRRIPPPKDFARRNLQLESGKDYPFEALLNTLAELGFERKDFVEEYGDFAVRGGILDIFPFVGDNPIRLEFWGDMIESIREFDSLSQRSIRNLQTASIIASLSGGSKEEPSSSLLAYLRPDALVLLDEPALIEQEVRELGREGITGILEWSTVEASLNGFSKVLHSTIHTPQDAGALDFSSISQPPTNGSIKFLLRNIASLNSEGVEVYLACDVPDEAERIKELLDEEMGGMQPEGEIPEKHARDSTSSPTSLTGSQEGALQGEEEELPGSSPLRYHIFTEALHSGFIYPPAKVAVFTEHEVFGRLKRRGIMRRKKFKGFSLKEARQLRRQDHVVHVDYGIGRFDGLRKILVRGVEQEVMKVVYAEEDVLYVNLNFVNRVQKYSSQEGHVPALTKLGGPDWERIKSKARKRVKDIARELIRLYARRKHEPGFAFARDTHWQKEMEASFMYEDTPDQAKTTVDVKSDMESPAPMDRLVCGDVGFGKTEIAVRAAFKAVLSGKQVGVLVPTTILAQQHFNTFLDRLGRYTVRIESLSRFKTKKEQTATLAALKEGKVDILIGTHRLLSKDVVFRELGLLVIDEEHRFGVTAKEKLRHLRATVDTLTLTATPIPRTLQFSLMGARDLSIINTPPRNRLPIITEIAQFDLQLVREAVLKELHRGGQVYFIHDRINDIEEVHNLLKSKIPEARFHIAHGQMKGRDLENAMLAFLEKKYDVLLCTKIIESGIDIPSVNTIIINRADRFGLAELYQLRGRVGRSNEQAYAYLLTPPLSSLPRLTLRRLQAIQEFTELGSGFNLAMRDLEIRGAGNLLGGEQSGFIMEMGFEMYQKIVEEAVAELKEEEFEGLFEGRKKDGRGEKSDTVVEADVEAFIPELYIESGTERLDFYRRLYAVESPEEVQGMREELRDRFGEYPEEVEHLFAIVDVKTIASRLGFTKLDLNGRLLILSFPSTEVKQFYEESDGNEAPFQKIMNRMTGWKQYRPNLKQEGKQLKLMVTMEAEKEPLMRLMQVKEFLQRVGA